MSQDLNPTKFHFGTNREAIYKNQRVVTYEIYCDITDTKINHCKVIIDRLYDNFFYIQNMIPILPKIESLLPLARP